jgi:hypothetical protein
LGFHLRGFRFRRLCQCDVLGLHDGRLSLLLTNLATLQSISLRNS